MNWMSRSSLILVSVTISNLMAYGPAVYAYTLFLKPLEDEFGWSRAVLGGSLSVFWLGAPLTPLIARSMDRFGAKPFLIGGAIVECVGYIALGFVDHMWQLYFIRTVMGIGKIAIITGSLILIPQWFTLNRGFALGIAMAGIHGGGLIVAPLTQILLDEFGWRTTAMILGAMIGAIAIPPLMLGVRDKKLGSEELQTAAKAQTSAGAIAPKSGYTLREAARLPLMHLYALVTLLYIAAYAGFLTHFAPYLSDLDFSAGWTASFMGLIAGGATLSVILWGVASDRWSNKIVLLGLFATMVATLIEAMTLSIYPNSTLAALTAFTFGVAIGCDALLFTVLSNIVGDKDYTNIAGVYYFLILVLYTVAPISVGFVFDVTGSYIPALAGLLALLLLSMILIAMASFGAPRRVPNLGT